MNDTNIAHVEYILDVYRELCDQEGPIQSRVMQKPQHPGFLWFPHHGTNCADRTGCGAFEVLWPWIGIVPIYIYLSLGAEPFVVCIPFNSQLGTFFNFLRDIGYETGCFI